METKIDEKGKIYTDLVPTASVRATLQTVDHLMQGDLHLRIGDRLKDELDRSPEFLALTDVEVIGTDGRVLFHAPFLAVNRRHIVWAMEAGPESERERE